jgi:hypothetical protein
MSDRWKRYRLRLRGVRPRPEPAPLKFAASAEMGLVEQANVALRELQATRTEALDAMRARAERAERDAAELRERAERDGETIATLRSGRSAAIDDLTARAEGAEAAVARLRDDNASLARSVIAAGDALRQVAQAPPGTTHAAKTALAAAGLAALAGDAREVPAGAQDGAEGRTEGFMP